ncbi:hypothetical protein [Fluviicola sp.]|uniref:hypothetical protein n=1 Tax=Fluviicola sp. TaxID=1917219 RepID=UPI0031D8E0B9
MKSSLLILCLLGSIYSSSQISDSIKIEGIGLFKIGKTTVSSIEELSKKFSTKIKSTNSSSDLYNLTTNNNKIIIQLFADTVKTYNSPSYTSYSSNVKTYRIIGYSAADIELNDLTVKFYNDTLYYMNCNMSSDLNNAIKLKYGEGKIEVKEKEVVCKNRSTGIERKLIEKTYFQKWDHDDIMAVSILSEYYNDKCERRLVSALTIESFSIGRVVNKIDDEIEDRLKERKKIEDKKKLDGF